MPPPSVNAPVAGDPIVVPFAPQLALLDAIAEAVGSYDFEQALNYLPELEQALQVSD